MTTKELFELLDSKAREIELSKGVVTQEDCQKIWRDHEDIIKSIALAESVPFEEFCVFCTEDLPECFWSRMYSNDGREEIFAGPVSG